VPIKIVLDTNILFENWFLSSPQLELLRRHSASGRSIVFIPSVVILELQNHYSDQLRKNITALRNLNSMLPPGEAPLVLPSPEDLVNEYSQHLQKRITELGFQIAEFTDITHDRMVSRALSKRKPFNDGAKGYRDSLIWEIILQKVVKGGDHTYFVTANCRDFAAGNQEVLHPILLEDIKQLGLPDDCITYIQTLGQLVDSIIMPDLPVMKSHERLSALQSQLMDDNILSDWISDHSKEIMDHLNKTESYAEQVFREAENSSVDNLEYPESFEVISVSKIDEQTAMVIGVAEIEANVNFAIFRADLYIHDPPYPFSIWSAGSNDHYVHAEMTISLSLRFTFSVSFETCDVTDFEVEDQTDLWGYCKKCGAIQYSGSTERCGSCNRRLY
jgi:hypothetical protein